jgi:hypothetical protein
VFYLFHHRGINPTEYFSCYSLTETEWEVIVRTDVSGFLGVQVILVGAGIAQAV